MERPRSKFDRSHQLLTTINEGDLVPIYCDDGSPTVPLSTSSKAWTYSDYYYCDEKGLPVETSSTTAIDSAAFCVYSAKSSRLFANMLQVEEYLEQEFAANPRMTFKIFALTAVVKPRPFSLADCIEYISTEADDN